MSSMNIIQQFLQRKGIDPSTLDGDEKATLEQWKVTLEKKDVTVDSIFDFCNNHVRHIESQFKDTTLSEDRLKRLTLLHSVYTSIRDLIRAPIDQREHFEQYLSTLLSLRKDT